MLLGFYSSAQCVPVAARVEQLRKFMWITHVASPRRCWRTANLKYVSGAAERPPVRPDVHRLHRQERQGQVGKEPRDLKIAIITRRTARTASTSRRATRGREEGGFNVVLKEGYAATTPDLSSLVIKLKHGARPDVVFPHRLQPRHCRCPAPGARAGPEISGALSATGPATACTTSSRSRR